MKVVCDIPKGTMEFEFVGNNVKVTVKEEWSIMMTSENLDNILIEINKERQ